MRLITLVTKTLQHPSGLSVSYDIGRTIVTIDDAETEITIMADDIPDLIEMLNMAMADIKDAIEDGEPNE